MRWCSHCRCSRCAGRTAPGCVPNAERRLADDPDHHHDAVDIRWAALQGLAGTIQDGEKDNMSGTASDVQDAAEKQEK